MHNSFYVLQFSKSYQLDKFDVTFLENYMLILLSLVQIDMLDGNLISFTLFQEKK